MVELTIADALHDRVGARLLTRGRFTDFCSQFGEVVVGRFEDVCGVHVGEFHPVLARVGVQDREPASGDRAFRLARQDKIGRAHV